MAIAFYKNYICAYMPIFSLVKNWETRGQIHGQVCAAIPLRTLEYVAANTMYYLTKNTKG